MKNEIGVFIISSGRSDRVTTLKQIPKRWLEFTKLSIPTKETSAYEKFQKRSLIYPIDAPSYIAVHRQYVMEHASYDYIWMMDDDLSFGVRRDGMKLKKCTDNDMEEFLAKILEYHKEGFSVVGISPQNGNHRVESDYADNGRIYRCYSIDRKAFEEANNSFILYEDKNVIEDFHMALNFLERGYPNRIIYKYAFNDVGGSNSPGGCSRYRTAELHGSSAKLLAKAHPGVVSLKIKRTKHSWQGFARDKDGYIVRQDVIVQWKKAFQRGTRKDNGISKFFK